MTLFVRACSVRGLLSLVVVVLTSASVGCSGRTGAEESGLTHASQRDVTTARTKFVAVLSELIETPSLSEDERLKAARILVQLGEVKGTRYLAKKSIDQGCQRDWKALSCVQALVDAGMPNEMIKGLIESDRVDDQLAGAIIASAKMDPAIVASIRSLMMQTDDARVAAYSALAIGEHGSASDAVVLFRTAHSQSMRQDVRRAAQYALGRFFGTEELDTEAFRQTTAELLESIDVTQ
jgi:hypothetical protein